MNAVIDAHMLGEQEGGNETYIAGLLQGFERIELTDDVRITALFSSRQVPVQKIGSPVRPIILGSDGNFQRLFLEIPSICRRSRADVLHVTYHAPPILPCPSVVSVHDISFRYYPQYFSPRVRLLLSTWMPLSMRRAAVVLTLSEASKRDIANHYPYARNKIRAIPLAAGPMVTAKPDTKSIERYTNGRDFILAVGTVQPRKNISRLIQAYLLLRQRGATNARLVIVGRSAWQGSEIQKIAAASPHSQDIVFTGYLDDAAVAALYRDCAVFIYPSLYEGFGLPVLEAMECGAPVITSNLSSLPEIAGDAAMLVDPYSIDEIGAAIDQVLTNAALREELRTRGPRQAARFSWEQTARETVEAYKWASQATRKP